MSKIYNSTKYQINTSMLKQDDINKLRKSNITYYLGKVVWKKQYGDKLAKKIKSSKKASTKTRWKASTRRSKADQFTLIKKYPLHREDTNYKVMTITLDEISILKKSGIKILSEINGFEW